jgi:hypothetical protein
MLAASPAVGSVCSKALEAAEAFPAARAAERASRKIPIGVFDPVSEILNLKSRTQGSS